MLAGQPLANYRRVSPKSSDIGQVIAGTCWTTLEFPNANDATKKNLSPTKAELPRK
jgi:hypothetical protein